MPRQRSIHLPAQWLPEDMPCIKGHLLLHLGLSGRLGGQGTCLPSGHPPPMFCLYLLLKNSFIEI